jgi:hypothetical protein
MLNLRRLHSAIDVRREAGDVHEVCFQSLGAHLAQADQSLSPGAALHAWPRSKMAREAPAIAYIRIVNSCRSSQAPHLPRLGR